MAGDARARLAGDQEAGLGEAIATAAKLDPKVEISHLSGMHVSLGRGDARGDCDYALQAIRRGHAALAIEIRGFGERRDRRPANVREPGCDARPLDPNVTCKHAAMVALLLGR